MSLGRPGRWYHAVAPVETVVACSGEQHRVSWARGKLALADHDLAAERTMLVFGGEPCTCLRILEMWSQQFGLPPEAFAQMDSWLGEDAVLAPPALAPVREMAMVLGWERAWRKSAFLHKKQARLLSDALTSRATKPLREHLNAVRASVGARMVSSVEVSVIHSDQAPALSGGVEGISIRARARLRGRWVVDVWGRGAAVVADAFVLEVTGARSPHDLDVTAARWRGSGSGAAPVPGLARLRRDGPDQPWSLTWMPEAGR
ncbi:MAG: hypothetical protein ACT4OS_11300 [Acidimicrobiales bacterium]